RPSNRPRSGNRVARGRHRSGRGMGTSRAALALEDLPCWRLPDIIMVRSLKPTGKIVRYPAIIYLLFFALLIQVPRCREAEGSPPKPVSFIREVAPILVGACLA